MPGWDLWSPSDRRRLCGTAVAVVAGLALAVAAVRWIGAVDRRRAAQTTLYNPARLTETLRRFTLASATNPAPRGYHRTEDLCRTMLQTMLGFPLPKVRPPWLVNPTTKRRLELDMYSAEHRIAFEYDGAQHDVFTPHFHGNDADRLRYRQLLDRLKTELCREHGVLLVRIPWTAVAVSEPARTARALERLLRKHRIPYRSVLPPPPPRPPPPSQ